MSNKNFLIKNGLSIGADNEVISSARAASLTSATITGDLTVDGSTLKVNSSNDRVGIGTTDPNMKLNISHSDQDGLRFNTTNTSESFIDFGDTDDNDVGQISYDHADNHMAFKTNATEYLKLTSQGTLNFTTPTTFSGQGDSLIGLHSNNYMYMYGGSAGLILHDNSAGSNRMLIRDSGSIELQTGGAERMKINSDGYMTLSRDGGDYGLQIRSTSNRSGLVIDKPGTSTIMGSLLVLSSDETYRLGTASYYHVEMKQNGDTKINQNLLLTDSFGFRAYSGYFSAGTSTGTFIFNTYGSGVYEITAAFGHYGYIPSYGCFKKAICSNGQGYVSSNSISVTDIATEISTTNGGSWSFSGYNSTSVPSGSNTTGTVRVVKNAGTYGGGGYYFVEVRGNQSS